MQEELLEALLSDPIWRLTSGELYHIAPADGKSGVLPFTPWPEQVKLYSAVHLNGKKKVIFLKARRPGGSTALGIDMLDRAIFLPGSQQSLVDQTASDASRKMDRIIGVALDNIPEWVKKDIEIKKRNESHLSLSFRGGATSDIYAGMDARGGSNDNLWISEWGVIQYEDPKRSAKIRTGGLPSARHGITMVETTWAGGRSGDLWELIEPTLNGSADDWEVLFSPWYADPRNTSESAMMDDVARKYFAKNYERFKAAGVNITEGQMRWWAQEKRTLGVFMSRENPSFLDECWTTPVPGSIYAEVIERARSEGRVCSMPISEGHLVHTAWDLGAPRQTRVIYFQVVGEWIHIVDIDPVTDETIVQRVARMRAKGYYYGSHYMPHDAKQTERSGKTLATEFAAAWLKVDPEYIGKYDALTGKMNPDEDYRKTGIRFVPRTNDLWVGINAGLQRFSALKFRASHCEEGLNVLALYRVPTIKDGNADKGEPVHDHSSHLADSFRTLFEALQHGMISFGVPEKVESRFDKMFGIGQAVQVKRGPTSTLYRGGMRIGA